MPKDIRKKKCIMGCTSWNTIHQFPKKNTPRRLEWFKIFGVSSTKSVLYACGWHFKPYYFNNQGKLSQQAKPMAPVKTEPNEFRNSSLPTSEFDTESDFDNSANNTQMELKNEFRNCSSSQPSESESDYEYSANFILTKDRNTTQMELKNELLNCSLAKTSDSESVFDNTECSANSIPSQDKNGIKVIPFEKICEVRNGYLKGHRNRWKSKYMQVKNERNILQVENIKLTQQLNKFKSLSEKLSAKIFNNTSTNTAPNIVL